MHSQFDFKNTLNHSILVFLGYLVFYTFFFSPVLFSDRLLAQPADGIAYFLPAFYAARELWTETVFAGYPIVADPQNMSWYPPSLLLSMIPQAWNMFVLLAYVLASSFTYCYIFNLTTSRLAATASGFIYGLCGFMVAYLPMAAMIHAAAWMPLILCALERLRHRLSRLWLIVGAVAISFCFFSGHPQISIYGIGIGFFYALFLGWNAPIGRWNYYRSISVVFCLGVALSAVQLVPTIELSRLSVRADITYDVFFSGSLPVWQGLQFIFPYLFGSAIAKGPYSSIYWGKWDPLTTSCYVGLLPLLLSVIGLIAYRKRDIVWFWFWVGVITLIFAFGEDLFLGRLLYHVPIYNLFRVQARHVFEFAFSVSVLAGLGISSIQSYRVSNYLIRKIIISGFILLITSVICINITYSIARNFSEKFLIKLNYLGIDRLSLLPWENPALAVPFMVFLLGALALFLWSHWKGHAGLSLVLICVLVLDLSSFGFWFRDWKRIPMLAPPLQVLEESSFINNYRSSLHNHHQRLLPSEGMAVSWEPTALIYPNLTRLWDLPSAGGYSPLILSRFSEVMKMDYTGLLNHIPTYASEHQLDLMSVRYLLTSAYGMVEQEGLTWADAGFPSLGSGGCASSDTQSSTTMDLQDVDYEATAIGIITQLGCSVEVPDQSEVAQIEITDAQGNGETHSLLAGRDTAEYAYDCADVKPFVKHQQAQVFSSIPISRPGGGTCQGHEYVAIVRLNRSQQISNLKLNWANLPGVMNIKHISLINEPQGTSLPLTSLGLSKKWRKVEQISSGIIYENQDVLPRTWLVPETIVLKPEEVLTAVHTSQLPDGRTYDPKTMALVEDAAGLFQSSSLKPTDSAKVLKLEETQVELQTQTADPAFLVLSDVFYPGWKATIDGKPTQIFQTNYIQRGIKVPAGNHIVRFEFHPLSFKLGVGITMASLFASIFWLLRRSSPHSAG